MFNQLHFCWTSSNVDVSTPLSIKNKVEIDFILKLIVLNIKKFWTYCPTYSSIAQVCKRLQVFTWTPISQGIISAKTKGKTGFLFLFFLKISHSGDQKKSSAIRYKGFFGLEKCAKVARFWGKNSEITIFRQWVLTGRQNKGGFLKFFTFLSGLKPKFANSSCGWWLVASV